MRRMMTKAQVCVHVRYMLRRDMSEVVSIENSCFDFGWTEEDFLRCLRQRCCLGAVAEHREKVVGFMVYELHKSHMHVLNFAVHPGHHRCGIGSQMVQKLVGKLSSHRRTRITLEVVETNLPAQLFFKRQGFKAIQVLRNHWNDGKDDYLMQHDHDDVC